MFRGLLLMLCALALAAPAAVAAEDEIFVDPGSPSGKEYALPIDSARKQAASGGRGTSSRTTDAPLFGEGVDADSAGGGGSGAGGSGDDDGARGRDKAGSQDADADADADAGVGADRGTPVTPRALAASPDGGMGTVAILGAGAGVLLLGGAIGLLLRRRSARAT